LSEEPSSIHSVCPLDNLSDVSVIYLVTLVADFELAASGSDNEMEKTKEPPGLASRGIRSGREAEWEWKIDEECLLVWEEGKLTVASPARRVPAAGTST